MFSDDDECGLPPKGAAAPQGATACDYKLVFVGDGGARTLPDDPASDEFKRAYFALAKNLAAPTGGAMTRPQTKPQPYPLFAGPNVTAALAGRPPSTWRPTRFAISTTPTASSARSTSINSAICRAAPPPGA